jgi:hypothetical protein
MIRARVAVWIGAIVAVAALIAWLGVRHWRPRWSIIQGAVVRSDTDTHKQAPIAGVTIAASHASASLNTNSDAAGYFRVAFPGTVLPGEIVHLHFKHPGYEDLDLAVPIRFRSSLRRLVIASMEPIAAPPVSASGSPPSTISDITVRYTVNSQSEVNFGSEVRTFQVVNHGNIPCHHRAPCSPDGYWKAATGSISLDAGVGNEFQDVRASCIAGPCPFTSIDASGFVNGGRRIVASALDWSDTATFLLQAEVFHTAIVSNVRESYPVVFGGGLNFTVPPTAEGVCLEAELNGNPVVFPLGPDLYLSWATCSVRSGSNAGKSTVYQCQLKPGFRFDARGPFSEH